MDVSQQKRENFLTGETFFIIVIYECAIGQSASFQSLQKQLGSQSSLFLFDNSLLAQSVPKTSFTIYYEHHPENPGVSAAYNCGFEKARQLKKKWLFLLDQDTQFDDAIFDNYEKAIRQYPRIEIFTSLLIDKRGIISPFRFLFGRGLRKKVILPGIHSFEKLYLINSGLLISLALFERTGGYDERFPLDFSDMVFIEKLYAQSLKFVLLNARLTHSLSSNSDKTNDAITVLDRFNQFCAAAKLFKKISTRKTILSFIVFPRAFKLFIVKKDFRFLFAAANALKNF